MSKRTYLLPVCDEDLGGLFKETESRSEASCCWVRI